MFSYVRNTKQCQTYAIECSAESSKFCKQARTCETLIEAMGMAIPEVTPQDARGFFEYCGYRRATLPV